MLWSILLSNTQEKENMTGRTLMMLKLKIKKEQDNKHKFARNKKVPDHLKYQVIN